jgi:hypothetical protein
VTYETSVVDPLRFFADYSATEIEAFYKKSLAGQMGNLFSRISNKKLIEQLPSPAAIYTAPATVEPEDERLIELLQTLPSGFAVIELVSQPLMTLIHYSYLR